MTDPDQCPHCRYGAIEVEPGSSLKYPCPDCEGTGRVIEEEEGWTLCADEVPDGEFGCEIKYEDESTGYGFYTGNDPCALDGWMCDV